MQGPNLLPRALVKKSGNLDLLPEVAAPSNRRTEIWTHPRARRGKGMFAKSGGGLASPNAAAPSQEYGCPHLLPGRRRCGRRRGLPRALVFLCAYVFRCARFVFGRCSRALPGGPRMPSVAATDS